MPTAAGIENAAQLLARYAQPTPLVRSAILSDRLGTDLWIKNETVSPVASFKWRGALTAVLRSGTARDGVVTSSTGNHGQGVAWAAATAGVPAHIFLPRGANPTKRRKIALLGAQIHDHDGDLDAVKELAIRFAAERGLPFLDDGESIDVIEGAGTVGHEIAAALPRIDTVFVPMGSGSLAAGVAIGVKARHPHAKVIAVQSSGSPAMVESFRARQPVERPIDTLADGLVCRVPARVALDALVRWVDDAVALPDELLVRATASMLVDAQLLVEPSGAAGLAAAMQQRLVAQTVVIVATGANISAPVLRQVVEQLEERDARAR